MKKTLALLLIGYAALALAETPNPDHAFFHKAAEGGMAEVEAGKLAQGKGTSAEVKNFGGMMVKDHSKANAKLMTLAAHRKVSLPKELNAEHKAMKEKLESLSGEAFDKAYIQGQIKDHEATAALLKSEIDGGKDADAKAFASETLPTVQAHLKMIKQIAGDKGDMQAK